MTGRRWLVYGTGAALLLWGAAARATGKPPVFAPGAVESVRRLSPEERQDRRFLQDAAADLRFRHDAARIALQRSQDAGVRELAEHVLRHHETAQPALVRLLHSRGMALPLMDADHVKLLKALSRAGGRKFDVAFVEAVAERADADEMAYYQRIASATTDAALSQWIEQQLPVMRHQLALAERVLHRGAARPRSEGRRPQP